MTQASIKEGSTQLYNDTAEHRIKKAIYRIREKPELIGLTVVADRLREYEPSEEYPLATDGRTLYFDPEYIMSLTDAEIRYEAVHLIMHVAYAHHLRLKEHHDETLAQVAMDLVINARLHQAEAFKNGFLGFPEDGFYMKEVDPDKHTFEWVYRQLQNGSMMPENMPAPGEQPWGSVITPKGTDAEAKQELDEISETLAAAEFAENMLERAIGEEAGNIVSKIRAGEGETPPWAFLKDLIEDIYSHERTWARPNLIFQEHGYLPARDKSVGVLHICVDTSGSMSSGDLALCLDNIIAIANEVGLQTIKLAMCDTRMQVNEDGDVWTEIDVASGVPPEINARGRGGTSFDAPFLQIEEDMEEVQCLIYMTDGEGYCQVEEPEYHTIWATFGHAFENYNSDHFGSVVYIAPDHIY